MVLSENNFNDQVSKSEEEWDVVVVACSMWHFSELLKITLGSENNQCFCPSDQQDLEKETTLWECHPSFCSWLRMLRDQDEQYTIHLNASHWGD